MATTTVVAVLAAACSGTGSSAQVEAPRAQQASAATEAPPPIDANTSLRQLCRDSFADVQVEAGLRVGLMTDSGSINDGTFNQFAHAGMQEAARCFGFETTYVASGASGDHVTHLENLVAQDLDAVITVGFPLAEATAAVAPRHPDVAFIGVDHSAVADADNYARVTFRDDQAGFLAGSAAGLLTESGTVGLIAGPDTVPPVVALADGFVAGVAHVAPEVTVLRTHIDSFSDQEAGAAQAVTHQQQGADVIFAPAGMTGSGAIVEAAQRGMWVIGVDQDQYLTTFEGGRAAGAERIATSSVKRVDLGVFLQLADVARGSFRGEAVVLDAATGGVTYAPAHGEEVPATLFTRLEEIRVGLAEDTIATAPTRPANHEG